MIPFVAHILAGALALASVGSENDSTVVVVRTWPGAPYVYVLAWSRDEAAYGLRATINQNGQLVEASRRGSHVLFVSVPMVRNNGGIRTAAILPDTVLRHYGFGKDANNCRGNAGCSPPAYSSILLPDEVLRSPRDSLMVTIQSDRTWTIVLPRAVIAAYLKTVDSVSAARRPRH